MDDELERIANGLDEVANVLTEAGLAEHAAKVDEFVEVLRGRSGVPERVEDRTTTVTRFDG